MAATLKHAMSLEAIAEMEGTTPRAIHTLITRALRKLRKQGLIFTARELAQHLDGNRREIVE